MLMQILLHVSLQVQTWGGSTATAGIVRWPTSAATRNVSAAGSAEVDVSGAMNAIVIFFSSGNLSVDGTSC